MILTLSFIAATLTASAQQIAANDSVFMGRIVNDECSIYIDMNLYKQNVICAGQEFLGEMAGYLGDFKDSRKWMFTNADLTSAHKAKLVITNDYGSEDLEATLTYIPSDTTYVLEQGDGSTMKIARNRKWQKLPPKIVFKRK